MNTIRMTEEMFMTSVQNTIKFPTRSVDETLNDDYNTRLLTRL